MQSSTLNGLDVHKATISVAVAQGQRGGEVRHWGTIAGFANSRTVITEIPGQAFR
jgi:hypothetical protein